MALNLNATKTGFDDIIEESVIVSKKILRRKLYAGTKITLTIDDETIEVTLPDNTETNLYIEVEIKRNV